MYSPAIITTEKAFQPLLSSKDRLNFVLPLNSFSEGDPSLVEISPYFSFGQIDFNASAQGSFLILDTTLSTQTEHPSLVFGSTPDYQERS